ncbi:hypothetical protein KI387_014353, partial [Taxus chinensis]
MTTTTEKFSHNIGQGGFGSVFWGKLQDEKQIAIKVLSLFSKLGIAQFLNEGWMGPNDSISTACATSTFYLIGAANHIIRGEA